MKILIIATGGTIDSRYENGAVDVTDTLSCRAAKLYTKHHDDVDFTVKKPLNILSERITGADFERLAAALLTEDMALYDGMILTCGSDNLGYIAAFAGLLLCRTQKPVMLVASDRVLDDPAANGYANFSAAVELIRGGHTGVFVPYRNRDGVVYVHRASHLRQADGCDDFTSFCGAYGVFDGKLSVMNDVPPAMIPEGVFSADHLPSFKRRVLAIRPYPMLDYGALCTDGYGAVLHLLYHSATLDAPHAVPFIRSCGLPVYLSPVKTGQKLYRTTADAIDAGAIPLYDLSPECAYIKLTLGLNQDKMPLEIFMGA